MPSRHVEARTAAFAPNHGVGGEAPWRGPAPLSAGVSFARHVISHPIGEGGMGTVYEARHAVLNKRVALKTLHGAPAADSALRDRFLREAELAARVRHPHVVDIHDAGIEEGVAFVVMELLEGEDLARHLAREGRMLAREAVDIIVPVIAGLAELHRLGIAHRDVKPENIFLAYDAHGDLVVKLVDFGISKVFAERERPSQIERVSGERTRQRFEGTPHYMAPEQMRGVTELDPRSDQYALGVVLYQCLSGALPYEGASLLDLAYRVCSGEHVPLSALRPDLPDELLAVVARAMSVDIEARFDSMQELGLALLPFASPDLSAQLAQLLSRRGRSSSLPPRRSSSPSLRPGPDASPFADASTLPAQNEGHGAAKPRTRRWGLLCALGLLLSSVYALREHSAPSAQLQRVLSPDLSFELLKLDAVKVPF